LIGVLDFVLKKYVPQGDAVHLRAHDPAAALAAAGALRGQGGMTSPSAGLAGHPAALAMASRHRVRLWEPIPWILAIAVFFAFPKYLGFGTELLVTILFALSLDLVLGYAGIVTLGHAAFFGAGAYAVGMLAKHGVWNEPITGLIVAVVAAAAFRARCAAYPAADLAHAPLHWRFWRRPTGARPTPAGSTASTACRSARSSGCSSSIRCIRRRSISTSSPSCSCASSSCARWSIRRSGRA
jgi:hypothetical protein